MFGCLAPCTVRCASAQQCSFPTPSKPCKLVPSNVATAQKSKSPQNTSNQGSSPTTPITTILKAQNSLSQAETRTRVAPNTPAVNASTCEQSKEGSSVQDPGPSATRQRQMAESLQRSLMLVVWYKNGLEPLRIPIQITTHPFFQLSELPRLVQDLSLTQDSYIDAYNRPMGHWEQHQIDTIRDISGETRLLYRFRPNLLEGLTECPSLDKEIEQLQNIGSKRASKDASSPTTRKRQRHWYDAPADTSTSSPQKISARKAVGESQDRELAPFPMSIPEPDGSHSESDDEPLEPLSSRYFGSHHAYFLV